LTGYGSGNAPEEMKQLAGKTILHGNIDPMLLFQGAPGDIERATVKILETLAPYGGIILGDGFNIVPGTDIANLEILRKTSQQFGAPNRKSTDA